MFIFQGFEVIALFTGEGSFFRRQLPLGLVSANVACLVFMMSMITVKDDFREVAYYIANGTTIFTIGGVCGLLGLVAAQLPAILQGKADTPNRREWLEIMAMLLIGASAALLAVGLFAGDEVIRGVADGSIPTFEEYVVAEGKASLTPSEAWVK
ncbi:hypothetical protein D3C72_632530 [compost metagenome]